MYLSYETQTSLVRLPRQVDEAVMFLYVSLVVIVLGVLTCKMKTKEQYTLFLYFSIPFSHLVPRWMWSLPLCRPRGYLLESSVGRIVQA